MAPALLDTLEKIDNAINNDASFSTTLLNDISNAVSNAESYADNVASQAQSAAESYADGVAGQAQSAAESYAANVASQAQSAAESYADGLASNYDPAGAASTAQSAAELYADGLASDILDGTSAFTEVNVNSVAVVKASTVAVTSAGTVNAFTFDGTAFKTAKALVKFGTAGHSQVSEILLTLDAANNIAITEYAEVGTNGELGTITASYNSGTVAIQVTTNQANTNVMVYATLLA